MIAILAPDPKLIMSFIDKNLRNIPYIRKMNFVFGEMIQPEFFPLRIANPENCLEKCRDCPIKTKLGLCPGCPEIIEKMKSIILQ